MEQLHWSDLPDRFSDRIMRRINRYFADIQFQSLRQQVWLLATAIRQEFSIDVTDVELSQLFGHSGGWAQGMIARHLHHTQAEVPNPRGRPRLVESDREKKLVQFCLLRQADRHPAAVEDVIDYMKESGAQVDRFWVRRFVERNADVLAIRQATLLEEDRHNVSPDDLRNYFDSVARRLKTIPSPFVWNADETRVGAPKKLQPPQVIVSSKSGPEPITVPAIRDDSQLTLLTAISAFGDSIPPFFLSRNQTFEKGLLAQQMFFEGHDYMIRTAPKSFMTELLFIDWLKTVFIPWNDNLRQKQQYAGPIILLLDGHASHITARVLAYAGSQRILIIRLVAHSSHISQLLDLCVFGLFKILYKKEKKVKGMKGETLKVYRAITAFYKATIIPMVRWSFLRAGFQLNPDKLFDPLTVNPDVVMTRIAAPEMTIEELVNPQTIEAGRMPPGAGRKRQHIPAPHEFSVSLQAYVQAVGGTCPLCGHSEEEESSEEEEPGRE
jgi:hypothetical protein